MRRLILGIFGVAGVFQFFRRIWVLTFLISTTILAAESGRQWKAKITPAQSPSTGKARGLTWEPNVTVDLVAQDSGASEPVAHLKGTLAPGWHVTYGKTWLPRGTQGETALDITLHGKTTPVSLHAIGPDGRMENIDATLRFEEWDSAIKQSIAARPKNRRAYFLTSLGPSLVTYSEAGISPYSMVSLRANVSYQFLLLPPYLEAALGGFGDLLPLTKSTNLSARFIGANARLGYVVPWIRRPWRLSLALGVYYTNMVVDNNAFGYSNLIWPQFFPVLTRELGSSDVLTFNGKYAPLVNGLAFVGLDSREWAVGVGYAHALKSGHPVYVNADYSNMSIVTGDLNLHTTAFSLAAGFGW